LIETLDSMKILLNFASQFDVTVTLHITFFLNIIIKNIYICYFFGNNLFFYIITHLYVYVYKCKFMKYYIVIVK